MPRSDPEAARACAQSVSAEARAIGGVTSREDTFAEWSTRWLAGRVQPGCAAVRDDRSHLRLHVNAVLGPLAMTRISRDDVERVVADLDRKVRLPEGGADRISWKTAINV